MPFPNESAARQESPSKYARFRRANDKGGKGVHFIFGITRAGKAEVQSIRFDKSWTPAEAKKWLADHDYKTGLVPATEKPSEHSSPTASQVAVRGATQNVSQSYKPDVSAAVGTTAPAMPVAKTQDGKSDLMGVDAPYLKDKTFPAPSDDAKSGKYKSDGNLLQAKEAEDLNGVKMGPATDPSKDPHAVTGREILRGAVPLLYNESETIEIPSEEALEWFDLAKTLAPPGMCPVQLAMGIAHELEHTDDPMKSAQTAIDHLLETKDYYSRLEAVNLSEIEMGAGYGLEVTRADAQSSGTALKQDATAEAVQSRDKPVYNEEDDEEDEDGMWVEAFRAGTFQDSDGVTRKWDPGDLVNIAQQYNRTADPKNPNRKMAPVVIGHPKDNAPAYGWIEQVKAAGNTLKAKLTELNPGFVEALKSGSYKTRSISLYPDLNIRHIGFLGGVQPAVPGLGPFAFASTEKAITYEYAEPEADMDEVKTLKAENRFFKKLFDMFKVDVSKAKEFAEPAEPAKAEPEAAAMPVEKTADHAAPDENALQQRVPETRSTDPNYKGEATMADKIVAPGEAEKSVPVEAIRADKDAMTKLEAEIAQLKTDVQRLTQENAAMAAELGSKETRERTQNHKEFCEKLVSDGRLRPADVEQTVLNMELRYKADAVASDFAEKKETPTLDNYKEYMAAMPRIVCFEELSRPVVAGNDGSKEKAISAGEKVMKWCEDYMQKNPGTNFSQAFSACETDDPDDFKEYISKEAFCDK